MVEGFTWFRTEEQVIMSDTQQDGEDRLPRTDELQGFSLIELLVVGDNRGAVCCRDWRVSDLY